MFRRFGAVFIFFGGIIFFLMTDLSLFRYANVGNSQICSIKQFQNLPADIDVLVVGSSRIRRGVGVSGWGEASGGLFVKVFNLGRPGKDILRSERIIADILDSGSTPKALILEADTDLLRSGKNSNWTWSKQTAGFMTWQDLFQFSSQIEQLNGYARIRIFLDGARSKLALAAGWLLNGTIVQAFQSQNHEPITVCWSSGFDLESVGKEKVRAARRDLQTQRFGPLESAYDSDFSYSSGRKVQSEIATLRRIVERAENAGIQVIVVRPQAYADPPLAPEVVDKLVTLIPQFRNPPETLARKLNKLQIDHHHFGPEGRVIYTQWLIETLLADRSGS